MVIVSELFIIYLLLISVAYSFLMVLLTDYFIKNNSYRKAVLLIVIAFLLAVAYAGYLLVITLSTSYMTKLSILMFILIFLILCLPSFLSLVVFIIRKKH
ncbi:hypothetical protein SAMN04487759_11818 [Kandleria vitulina]|uniref:Uncharacterized protein n=1 Tax=Kandleria vitulina TaxID=1630 RepID=A0A1H2U4I4_9FIRM|nr:hypothetical protein [Kandleria vitulina]SDW50838.1 hypothetical protein SAMN04487759_11818 [Kandleria vitulina]